jgi:FkbM family methyltransferase
MTFVDVGANAGLYTVIAAHVAGPSGHVLAIEPQPQLRALLERNLRLNRLSNVSIETIAVGRGSGKGRLYQVSSTNDGEATLRPSAEASSFDAPSLEVRIDTLSALVAKRGLPDVDGMKVDVEGGELDVLQGFEDQLASRPPRFIFYEGIDRHLARFSARLAELHGLFWTHGYTVYRLRYGGWHRVRAHPERKHVSGDFLAVHHGQSLRRRVGP